MSSTNKLTFSAIDPVFVSNIPEYKEEKIRNKNYVSYGADNRYPEYLWNLYLSVASLQSIVNGTADFIGGDSIYFKMGVMNKSGETASDIIRKISIDLLIFGGFALQVIRNLGGGVAEIYALDFMKVRSDEKNEIFYYSNNWSKWGEKASVYPKFGVDDSNPSSIFYYKGNITRGVYPTPIYNAALQACELEKAINEFHLNNINNGFASNLIINFNNGEPNEEQQEQIERDIEEKFGGYQNAGRILIMYNDSSENAATVERLNDDHTDEKYQSLAKRSREQIFTAFRANPCLFGLNPENNGFSQIEFEAAYKLYSKTVVGPMQNVITDTFNKIFGEEVITINPFTIKWDE